MYRTLEFLITGYWPHSHDLLALLASQAESQIPSYWGPYAPLYHKALLASQAKLQVPSYWGPYAPAAKSLIYYHEVFLAPPLELLWANSPSCVQRLVQHGFTHYAQVCVTNYVYFEMSGFGTLAILPLQRALGFYDSYLWMSSLLRLSAGYLLCEDLSIVETMGLAVNGLAQVALVYLLEIEPGPLAFDGGIGFMLSAAGSLFGGFFVLICSP